MSTNIPIIDLKLVLEHDKLKINPEIWKDAARRFKSALQTTGFVYLTNHGISAQVVNLKKKILAKFCFTYKKFQIEDAFRESRSLFSLPIDIKSKYSRDFTTTFHGYTQVGGERFE